MREDVKRLLETRPIWQLLNDPVYKDLTEAREIAKKQNDRQSVETLDQLINEYKQSFKT